MAGVPLVKGHYALISLKNTFDFFRSLLGARGKPGPEAELEPSVQDLLCVRHCAECEPRLGQWGFPHSQRREGVSSSHFVDAKTEAQKLNNWAQSQPGFWPRPSDPKLHVLCAQPHRPGLQMAMEGLCSTVSIYSARA